MGNLLRIIIKELNLSVDQGGIKLNIIPEVILLSKLPVRKAAAWNKALTKLSCSTTQGSPHLHYLCYTVYYSENIKHINKHSICSM
jgi:hypothetical protein